MLTYFRAVVRFIVHVAYFAELNFIKNDTNYRLERFNFVSSIETPSFLGEHLIFVFTEISYFHKTLKLNIFGILLSSNFSSYTIFKLYIKEDFSKHVDKFCITFAEQCLI